ncbi:MAG: hypothetical protein ABI203_07445 [Mucilaginibacter sp.]
MGKIDPAVAVQMIGNYAEKRKKLIDGAYGMNDTKSIWFTIDEVKQFVSGLSANASGVRIYLGVYNADYPSTPNQTCIIAIQTTKDPITGADKDPLQQDAGPYGDPPPVNQGRPCPPYCF